MGRHILSIHSLYPQTLVFVQTVKDFYSFNLKFLLPKQSHNFATQPGHIISHFIGHEGPGSVCSFLKKKGWLVDIEAFPSHRHREVPTFTIEGTLTEEGYRKLSNTPQLF